MPQSCRWLALGSLFVLAPAVMGQSGPVTELTVEPAQITLTHADDRQQLLVTGKLGDGSLRDLTAKAQFASTRPSIAVVSSQGLVTPKAAGQAAIRVTAEGVSREIPVTVKSIAPRLVSFANDVMPILARAGCNSGACHGAAAGKKGFKISLRGYDPANDYLSLTRATDGRRLDFVNPGNSLLVLKPTGQVPHEGGKRFDWHHPYAKTVTRWIAEGGLSDLATAPKLVGLDVAPTFRSAPMTGLAQKLLVTARFSDGSLRDVSADSRYSSSNDMAALVDDDGLVKMPAKGEAVVMVRYGHLMALSNLVVLQHDPAFVWTNPPENNAVDRLVNAKLKKMEIVPSALCTDTEFLRRVSYDVIGLPPTPAEIRSFLADNRPGKRARIIDALLERPEHAEFWALKWGDLLKLRFEQTKDQTWPMYRWLRDSIARNKPYDRFVREIIAAQGSCAENPPANFHRVFNNANEAAEAAAQVFFGVRLLCAKCHDHPFEKWVQNDYYGWSAFFSQVGRKANGRRDDLVIFRNQMPAQATHSTTGAALTPKFLDAASIKVDATEDARALLAEWMTRKDNPLFATAAVNRFWSHLFGRGIIDPVDDIRSSNPPSNGPLLDALTKDFVDHDFDVRHILRTMLNSRTYQLSARTNKSNAGDTVNFSHAVPRRLAAEQVLDTLSQATGIKESFRSRFGEATVALPAGGVRAGQLPDRQLTSELLDIFGRPRGESSCACERTEDVSMTLALHLINGQSLSRRLADPASNLTKLANTPKISYAEIIEEVYLLVLCRLPEPAEMAAMQRHFAAAPNKLQAAQDAMWVLFNTKEFLFNH